MRIVCPEPSKNKSERIKQLFDQISEWISTSELACLIRIFGGDMTKSKSLKKKITWTNDFAEVWDYRKKQTNGGERWEITDEPIVVENARIIMDCVSKLGLVGINAPSKKPNYILPLGGARLSNLYRCKHAANIYNEYQENDINVVALSGMREINQIEREFTDQYAPNASTEFDCINCGLVESFGVKEDDYSEDGELLENLNLSWALRKYNEKKVFSLAAPSPDPTRRANSMDTFRYFMEKFNVSEGESICLVTSEIYVPFQQLKFIELALENNLFVDCVGVPQNDTDGIQFSKVCNYLQETKATINAMKHLAEIYL